MSKVITLDNLKAYTTKLLSKIPGIYVGATETQDATSGTVPAATSDDKDKFLKGDGTWATVNQDEFVEISAETVRSLFDAN